MMIQIRKYINISVDCIKSMWSRSEYRILFVLSLIFIVIRLPAANLLFFLHDERDIVFSGWSLARTGSDLYGNFFPLNFVGINPNNPLISIWWSAAWFVFFPVQSIFVARLGFIVFSTSVLPITYLLANKLFKNTLLSIVTTTVFCFSPWVYHLFSLGMDITVAVPILLLSILLQLHHRTKLASFLYLLSYFNYQGFRFVIPVIMLCVEYVLFRSEIEKPKIVDYSKLLKKFCYWLLVFFIFILISIFIEGSATSGRNSQLVFFRSEDYAKAVDLKRSQVMKGVPTPLISIFHNKLVEGANQILHSSIKGLDVSRLFIVGDSSPINGPAYGGLFFLWQLPFMAYGLICLGKKEYRNATWSVAFVLIGLITPALRYENDTYAIRGFLSSLGFASIIGVGLTSAYKQLSYMHKGLRYFLMSILFLIVTINLLYFSYNYFFRRPSYVSGSFNEIERYLTNIILKSEKKKHYVFDHFPKDYYLSTAFIVGQSIKEVQKSAKSKIYKTDNIIFLHCDDLKNMEYNSEEKYIISSRCYDNNRFDLLRSSKYVENIYSTDFIKTVLFITNNERSSQDIFITK